MTFPSYRGERRVFTAALIDWTSARFGTSSWFHPTFAAVHLFGAISAGVLFVLSVLGVIYHLEQLGL